MILGIILTILGLLGFICGLIFPFIFKNINWIFLILTLFLIAPGIAILKGKPCEVPIKQDVIDDKMICRETQIITDNDPVKIYENSMKSKELTIKIPKGQEIDWQESAKQEKIVFKNINTKPKSWEEYLRSGNHPNKLWFINPAYKSTGGIGSTGGDIKDFNLNKSGCCMSAYLPSRELTEAFLAMMQLMSLRQAWIDDWEPDWSNFDNSKWGIINHANKLTISLFGNSSRPLSFPTEEMATDFMNCFKDLLEIAKPLI